MQSNDIFTKVQVKSPPYSVFDLSHDVKLSMQMGKLVPTACIECVPGDKFDIRTEALFRMMPMVTPPMHEIEVFNHWFFVPNRIIWKDFEQWITGGQMVNLTPPAFPLIATAAQPLSVNYSTLPQYLGLPFCGVDIADDISALPFLGYYLIWHEWYRDQNNQPSPSGEYWQPAPGGLFTPAQVTEFTTLRDRAWEHDYFTSALPFAQKGDPVEIPIDVNAPVSWVSNPSANPQIVDPVTGVPVANATLGSNATAEFVNTVGGAAVAYDPNGSLEVLAGSSTTLINDLRTSIALQTWLELNARGGSRYSEHLMAHYGVKSSDARIQRPEYIGGTRSKMAISEVLQTSETAGTPQGTMSGHGISVASGGASTYRCEEHGYMFCITSIRPRTAYAQGIPKHFQKFEREEIYFPSFAFLGEQEIKKKELWIDGGTGVPSNATFGYIPRYSEYRYLPSRVNGQLAPGGSLEFWSLVREFTALPDLNADFIICNPSKRIFADTDPNADDIVGHLFHQIRAVRPLPKYGTPAGLVS